MPPGVDSVDVERRVTLDAKSGELLEDVESGTYGLRALELGRKLDKVRDIEVSVELRDPEAAAPVAEADDDADEDDGEDSGELASPTDVRPDDEVQREAASASVRVRWADESDSDEDWLGHSDGESAVHKASLCMPGRDA